MSISSTIAADSKALPIAKYFSQNIVFIDAQVEDYQSLIDGVVPGTEVILLNSTQDGVEQITEHLINRSNVDSVHIVSHGSPGCLYLGNSQLSLDTLEDYKSQLQAGFSNSTHLLLYGCNVAAGDAGAEFIEKLHQLTGVEIAASTNRTGSAALGGDWELEVSTGKHRTPLAFKSELTATYASVLALTRVSINTTGFPGNADSDRPSISADGNFVAFGSNASNFSFDNNGAPDIFVRNRLTNSTSLISQSSFSNDPDIGNALSQQASISGDGSLVAFASQASNLVTGDNNSVQEIFVRDINTNTTTLVSVDSQGNQPSFFDSTDGLGEPSISGNGRFVAFASDALDLVPNDLNGLGVDIVVYDRENDTANIVSIDSNGNPTIEISQSPSISADGRFVAFDSFGQLAPNDNNNDNDVFVHDRDPDKNGVFDEGNGITTLISRSPLTNNSGNEGSFGASISDDGRFVAFGSLATDLTSEPGNINPDLNPDVFVHDRQTNTTSLVSGASNGGASNGGAGSFGISISPDGRFVAFASGSTNLVDGVNDDNNASDIFVRDLMTNQTAIISVDSEGNVGNFGSFRPSITTVDETVVVAFSSDAANLASDGDISIRDIFVFEENIDDLFTEVEVTDNLKVDTLVDENDGDLSPGDISLREAIIEANNTPGLDTIEFDAGLSGGTINLTDGTLEITDDLSIDGLGSSNLSVSGNKTFDIFSIDDHSQVTIQRLSIVNGENGIDLGNDNSLEVINSFFSFNHEAAISGGDDNKLTVSNSVISFNQGDGIQLSDNNSLELSDNEIFENGGNGIKLDNDNTLTVSESSIQSHQGNGIQVEENNTVTVDTVGITQNEGNGIQLEDNNTVTLSSNSADRNTISFNKGYGIFGGNNNNLSVAVSDLENNDAGGIQMEDSNSLQAFASDILFNGGDGIQLEDENTVTLNLTQVKNNSGIGLSGDNDNNLEISGSTIENNNAGGIQLEDGNTLITLESDILLNGGNGIEFNDENKVKVEQSRIENNSGVGLLGNNDNEIIVCSSTIDHNGDDGILIQDNNLITLIQQTSISNNLGDGVSIGDDNPPITVGKIVVEGNGGLDFRGVDGNFDTAVDVNFGDCDFHL